MIRRSIALAFMLLLTATTVFGQMTGLKINRIFNEKYTSDPQVSQTFLSGDNIFLQHYSVNTLATFRGPATTYAKILKPLVTADGASATSRDVRYRDGKLSYAFYVLPGASGKADELRYIYYMNPVGEKKKDVMLIYFDGPINPQAATGIISKLAAPARKSD